MRKSGFVLALVFVLVYWVFSAVNFNWVENLELVTLNFRMRLRGEMVHQDLVKIAAVDDHSLSYLYHHEGNSWPWSRDVYARLLERLGQAGAKSIIMDISFDTYRDKGNSGDQQFAESLFFNPYVVLGTTLINNRDEFKELDPLFQKKLSNEQDYFRFRYKLVDIDRYYLPDFFTTYKMIPPEELFVNTAFAYGTFEIGLPGPDGIYHYLPLVINEEYLSDQGETSMVLLPNIDILGLAAYLGIQPGDYLLDLPRKEIRIGELTIPVDSSGYFTLNYYGKRSFSEISVIDILQAEISELEEIFKDKMVLIGYTAQAKGIFDARQTPFNNNEAGIQIHATLLQNILDKNFLTRVPFWVNLLMIFLFFLVADFILQIGNLRYSILLTIIFILLVNLVNYLLFINNIWLDIFYLDLILTLYLLANVIIKVYRENKERLQTKSFFARYVPAEVVEVILQDPSQINPGGEEKNITILFSDIVNFTGIAEQLSATELVRLLNEYLGEQASIIKNEYHGTLDKFIGDAIVAIFGAPFSQQDDPIRAVNAAIAMRDKARELQNKWEKRGERIVFDLGVGINTGTAVVGNIGSPDRVNYTCIGDSVNIAARLEAATRETGSKILISEDTYQQVKDYFVCKKIENLSVKGKKEALTVYSVLSSKNKMGVKE